MGAFALGPTNCRIRDVRAKVAALESAWDPDVASFSDFMQRLFSGRGAAVDDRTALLSAMEETSPDAIIMIDPDGTVRSFNAAAERLFGYARDEAVGRNVKMLMPPHFRAEHDGYLSRYLRTGEKRIIGIGRIVAGEKKDGSTFPIELSVGESTVNGKRVFVGFIRDLSEIQREQRRVQELQQELFHVSRLSEMGQVASSLAHEVNQPLTAIVNYLEVARELVKAGEGESARAFGEVIEKLWAQTTRAADIVKRLRAFIDRRDSETRVENLNVLVEEALALGLVGPASRGVRVVMDLESDLPAVVVDRVQVQQVMVNLVRNAVDAMAGSPYRSLKITSRREGALTHLEVADTGPGVSDDVAQKLFQAFVTTKEEGMGVGLSICRTIVENHGGRIWFKNGEAGGAVFHVTLPVADARAAG